MNKIEPEIEIVQYSHEYTKLLESKPNSLLKNKLFVILTLSKWLSDFGDGLSYLVKIVIIKDLRYISLFIAVQSIMNLLFSPMIGNFVEKSEKKHLIILFSQICLVLNSSLAYVAYEYHDFWFLVYANIMIFSIFGSIKNSSYQGLIPEVLKQKLEQNNSDKNNSDLETLIIRSNTVQIIMIAVIYFMSTMVSGPIIQYLSGFVNLLMDTFLYILSICTLVYFHCDIIKQTYLTNNLKGTFQEEYQKSAIDHNLVDLQLLTDDQRILLVEPITFYNGIKYMSSHPQIWCQVMINSLLYYIYGIFEITNYRVGFDDYDVLILSIIIGLGSTGPMIHYFDRCDRYVLNTIFGIISTVLYWFVYNEQWINNNVLVIVLWFIGLWLFNYINSAFWIMKNSLIQKEEHAKYTSRLSSYSAGFILTTRALGSFTGSYIESYQWYCVVVCWCVIVGLMYRYHRSL
jgi:hypothetical protein